MEKSTLWTIIVCFALLAAVFFFQAFTANQRYEEEPETVEELIEPVSNYQYKSVSSNKQTTFDLETDLFKITFDTKGASISSMMLKEHSNADGRPVDIIFRGEKDPNAFLLYWADDVTSPILDNFSYSVEGKKVIFRNTYKDPAGKQFTLVKTYEFKDGEYLFALDVKVEGEGLNNGSYAYTVGFGPQVGPNFTQMKNNNYDYRRFYVGLVKDNGKVKRSSVRLSGNQFNSTRHFNWISLTSKYFTVIARPEDTGIAYKYQANQLTDTEVAQSDNLFVSVPSSASESNRIYFYCGPQLKNTLKKYYNGSDNAWGLRNYNLEDAMESGSVLGWLEIGLKWALLLIQKVVRNYGIAIIILTLILKLVLWPLQKKSTESTAKISALGPQIEALKEKYPDNQQKQNLEMSKLYKENGINPMGGCLPLLIQFPILIAFYGMLNRHIELRGAMFIPGWIPDLSLPDTVAVLGFRIPLLGNEIHLLPIIYTASMIFSMKFTQASNPSTADAQGQKGTMWFMTWGMPIMFFFILYSAPSGLLVYWTVQNALSIIQQIYTNKKMKKGNFTLKKPDKEKEEPEAVRKYQEKLKKLEQLKAQAEKEAAKKKNK